jgi:hypothetical protein
MHRWRRVTCLIVCGLVLGLTCGCNGPRAEAARAPAARPGDWSRRSLLDVQLEDARTVAARAFRKHFRLDMDASTGNHLVSVPADYRARDRQRLRDVLGPTRSQHRKLGELRMVQEGPNVLVQTRVQIQRLETPERAAFARQRGDDRPTDTPIERPGGTGPARQQEWVDTGRDRELEQRMLDDIVQEIAVIRIAPEVRDIE